MFRVSAPFCAYKDYDRDRVLGVPGFTDCRRYYHGRLQVSSDTAKPLETALIEKIDTRGASYQ